MASGSKGKTAAREAAESDPKLPQISHAYNAIKLTNYFSNILKQKHHHQQQQRFDSSTTNSGEHWRKQQLERQIPSQDVRLLAAPNQLERRVGLDAGMGEKSDCNLLLENDSGATKNQNTTRQTLSDEIKFIQSQKRLASQFSASLFYLNPSDKTAPSGQSKTTPATSKQTKPIACFKCKRPVESGTTCVRVDNLMRARSVQQAKCSSQTNNSNKKAIFQEAGATCSRSRRGFRTQEDAIEAEEQRAEKCAIKMDTSTTNTTNTNSSDKQNSDEKNSSDEGLGSGSSSSSSTSSAANSHCDDRETPPHLHDHHHQDHQQPVAQAPATCLIDSPVGATRAELSIDSLADHPNRRAKSTSGRLFSRKSRTLTWSASLGSLSASFKFGSKSAAAANSKSRSETNLNATVEANGDDDGDESIGRRCRPLEPTSDSIYFHNDCFNCATCNELLVDLRALIYLSDSDESHQPDFKDSSSRQSEYVNLEPAEVGRREAGDDSQQATSKTQISLYCHRHFVELFKPRCQQCDCLILDEECTEAEGKVWHIKHFCCAECSVPLGGHQYIIVDQALNQTRLRQQQQQPNHRTSGELTPKNLTNQPFCLGCFDKIFGETCVQCNRLITCDSGAINHDLRSWHASADCFKCQHCSKSLLGCPFLPSQDGRIYCSIECCEISSNSSQQPSLRQQQQQQRPSMSLAHYLDPRAIIMTNASAAGQQAATNSSEPVTSSAHGPVGSDSLVRHRPLIDYLILSAHSDQTSRHMLQYIQTRFERSLRSDAHTKEAQNNTNRAQELKLLDEIDQALNKLTASTNTNTKRELQLRRDKLNPFLVDNSQQASSDTNESQRRARAMQENEFVCMMMDQVLGEPTANIANNLGYMNLDSISVDISKPNGGRNSELQPNSNKLVGIDCVDRAPAVTVGNEASARLVGQQRGQRSKLSQCSPVASLISNEGTISDHSATSSGVSTAPPGQSSANGSLKSHSPLSSTSSHSSVVSSASSAHSSVSSSAIATSTSTAPTAAANNQRLNQRSVGSQLAPSVLQTNGEKAANSAANQRQLPAGGICSIAASLERRRRVQPITELSVVDLLTVADDQINSSIRHQQMLGHNQSDRPISPACDGFDRLVNQFTELNSNQQRVQRTIGPKGSMGSVKPKTTSAITSGRQQSDSFFFELTQRLPRTRVNPNQNQSEQQSGAGGGGSGGAMLQVASNGPVDTNGLPTVVDMSNGSLGGGAQSSGVVAPIGDSAPAIGGEGEVRQITDHYSTVNKTRNRQQMASDKDGEQNQRRRTTRDDFFAITSPLLNFQVDTLTTANTSVPLNKAGQDVTQQQQQHPGQMFRPVSSLSIFANNDSSNSTDPTAAPTRHGFYSTNSLNRQQTNQLLQLLPNAATAAAATTTMGCDGSPNNKQQKPLTRPAKSVSFDPNVKDPPSSSTLGRTSALKSALKQQSQMTNWHQQQDQLACHELAASMSQQQQNQLLPIASSATMPASFAAQLKATTGSMVAYNAHYDEFGRRIKLSTLMQHLQQQQQQQLQQQQQQVPDPMTVSLLLAAEEQERQQQLEFNKSLTSDSSPLPSGSLLAKLTGASSSRGGRREERKMLQGEQQQAIQIQPGSILQVAPVSISGDFAPPQMQPSTSGFGGGQLQRGEPHGDQEAHSTTLHRRTRARVSQSSSCSHSRRSGGRSSYSRRRSSRAPPGGRHRRERSCRAPPRRATRCTTRHCRYCEYDSEETDYSSSCSTCSSSSSTDDESYTDYESDHRKHRNNSSSTSSAETRPKHSYRRNCDEANSFSGYTSASSSEEDAYDDEDDERRSCTSNSSSARSISPAYRSSKARRVHRRRRNSRSSSNHSSARSRTSSSSTRSRTSSSSTRSRQKKAN